MKIFNLLCAAGTVLYYKENNAGTVKKAGGEKFKFFQEETIGKELKEQEAKLLSSILAESSGDEELCIPKLELGLARRDWDMPKEETEE